MSCRQANYGAECIFSRRMIVLFGQRSQNVCSLIHEATIHLRLLNLPYRNFDFEDVYMQSAVLTVTVCDKVSDQNINLIKKKA